MKVQTRNKIASIIIVLGTIIGNGVFSSNTGFVNQKYTLDATPAGWAFSIWTVIYAGLAYLAFFTSFTSKQVSLLFITGILNNTWLILWGKQNITLATLVLVTLSVLIWYLLSITNNQEQRFVIGIYGGWSLVAALLNISILLYDQKITDKKGSSVFFISIISLLLVYYIQTKNLKVPRTSLGAVAWASVAILSKGYTPGLIPAVLSGYALLKQ